MSEVNYLERLIKFLKLKSVRKIASFDTSANNNQSLLIMIHHDKHAIKPNTFIIIMPIEKPDVAEVGGVKVDVKR